MTHRALLALGSNLGDRWGFLRDAVASLPDVVAVSDVYETPPVGGPSQGPYLNCVVRLETLLGARALLDEARRRENEAGRERIERWGPRTLDVDVLWVDGEEVDEPDLEVPHPRMFERAFVLVPLFDVAPDLLPDGPEGVSDGYGEIVSLGPLVGDVSRGSRETLSSARSGEA
ncbi:MAG: 2-amino-4-hydroxy-6-hydroxymethyldihydropteridine diphosphokinase [Acidimicrobiales bacterium]|jgi:2-amino-4-hydroxy-6-hydroxymethyldihydropteridine diphosphokinase|nr:2-amino-4-hydroxy-6-hydroxymethyldihydropteridine diphosphokinase [Acidimicrobiales bacterium]